MSNYELIIVIYLIIFTWFVFRVTFNGGMRNKIENKLNARFYNNKLRDLIKSPYKNMDMLSVFNNFITVASSRISPYEEGFPFNPEVLSSDYDDAEYSFHDIKYKYHINKKKIPSHYHSIRNIVKINKDIGRLENVISGYMIDVSINSLYELLTQSIEEFKGNTVYYDIDESSRKWFDYFSNILLRIIKNQTDYSAVDIVNVINEYYDYAEKKYFSDDNRLDKNVRTITIKQLQVAYVFRRCVYKLLNEHKNADLLLESLEKWEQYQLLTWCYSWVSIHQSKTAIGRMFWRIASLLLRG